MTGNAHACMVCAASFVVQFVVLGIQNSYGVLFTPLLTEFKGSEMVTAWPGTLSFTLIYLFGPLVAVLCRRYGCRVITCCGAFLAALGLLMTSYVTQLSLLFVTYGVTWGLGASMSYFGSLLVLNSYFDKRLSLAYGVALAGAGVGVPVVATSMSYLIGSYGWRFAVRLLAILGVFVFLCGQLFKPPQTPARNYGCTKSLICQSKSQNKGHVTAKWGYVNKKGIRAIIDLSRVFLDVRLFARNKALVAWTSGLCLILSGYFMPFVFLVRMASDVGVPASNGALLVGYQAITQTVFKVIFGALGDMKPSKRITLLQVAALVSAVNTTLCPLSRDYAGFVVYVVVFGVCDGCFAVMFSMGTHYIVGTEDMPVVFGNVCSVVAMAQAFATPLAGFVYDVYQDYSLAFFISGGLTSLGVCVLFLVPLLMEEANETRTSCQDLDIRTADESTIADTTLTSSDCQETMNELYSRQETMNEFYSRQETMNELYSRREKGDTSSGFSGASAKEVTETSERAIHSLNTCSEMTNRLPDISDGSDECNPPGEGENEFRNKKQDMIQDIFSFDSDSRYFQIEPKVVCNENGARRSCHGSVDYCLTYEPGQDGQEVYLEGLCPVDSLSYLELNERRASDFLKHSKISLVSARETNYQQLDSGCSSSGVLLDEIVEDLLTKKHGDSFMELLKDFSLANKYVTSKRKREENENPAEVELSFGCPRDCSCDRETPV
ncbi:monocarboxylate transporter 10 [Nematostella vectensis]|uniref:monocarboxylate transporter 10 n=1 Tax=Nematostella vectensis TaxID=45351 RepID=UPI0020776CC0|nr:monocarboxylate transporter 10 [Nematostella vectensis]